MTKMSGQYQTGSYKNTRPSPPPKQKLTCKYRNQSEYRSSYNLVYQQLFNTNSGGIANLCRPIDPSSSSSIARGSRLGGLSGLSIISVKSSTNGTVVFDGRRKSVVVLAVTLCKSNSSNQVECDRQGKEGALSRGGGCTIALTGDCRFFNLFKHLLHVIISRTEIRT